MNDFGCFCKSTQFIDALSCCLSKSCNTADQKSESVEVHERTSADSLRLSCIRSRAMWNLQYHNSKLSRMFTFRDNRHKRNRVHSSDRHRHGNIWRHFEDCNHYQQLHSGVHYSRRRRAREFWRERHIYWIVQHKCCDSQLYHDQRSRAAVSLHRLQW